jgi:hypothetical protein
MPWARTDEAKVAKVNKPARKRIVGRLLEVRAGQVNGPPMPASLSIYTTHIIQLELHRWNPTFRSQPCEPPSTRMAIVVKFGFDHDNGPQRPRTTRRPAEYAHITFRRAEFEGIALGIKLLNFLNRFVQDRVSGFGKIKGSHMTAWRNLRT